MATADGDIPDEEVAENIALVLYTVVCKHGGFLEVTKAAPLLGAQGIAYIGQHGFFPLLRTSIGDILKLDVEQPSRRATLRALVNIELCSDYKQSECTVVDCPRLHVCPFFVKGQCRFGQRCRYHHDFEDWHEQAILRDHMLDGLDRESLLALLRQVIFGSLDLLGDIDVCPDYNTAVGCPFGNSCPKFHLCHLFTKGKCNRGTHCNKSHASIEEKSRLFSHSQRVHNARSKAVKHAITAGMLAGAQFVIAQHLGGKQQKCPTVDEICGFHLKGTCQYGNSCNRYKNNLPYLWQILVSWKDGSGKWFKFSESHNQNIERDYCDVTKNTSIEVKIDNGQGGMSLLIYFEDMLAKNVTGDCTACIRRISTPSWLNASPGDSFASHWTWYWTNDQNQWTPYNDTAHDLHGLSNEKLEENYLSGAELVTLSLNQNQYVIDFRNLLQTNTSTGTARRIRRRPSQFIGLEDLSVMKSRPRGRPLPSPHSVETRMLPRTWTSMTEDLEVDMITLGSSSDEYRQAESEFSRTLSGRTIHKIERIQNADLWESYTRKLSKLSRKMGSPAAERRLFHGTNETSVKAICQQGFDWRLCGVHGTAFGKGSYFARDASYSDGYAQSSTQGYRMMFLAKVIVGSFVVGNSSTVRPPPMNTSNPHELHHSCVDDLNNPSIFVIFDNDQAYPEMLITYT